MLRSNTLILTWVFSSFLTLTGCQHSKKASPQDAKEQSMNRIAKTMHAQGNLKTAYNFYSDVLKSNPKNIDAHLGLMDLALSHHDPRDAYKQYQLAEKHIGKSKRLDHYLFRIYMALGDLKSAHSHALMLTQTDSKDPKSWRQLGTVLDAQNRHQAAQDAYQKALEIKPDSIKTKSNLGLSYALSGQAQKAVDTLKPVILDPLSTPKDKHNYVMALVLNNQIEEAELLLAEDLPPSQRLETISYLQSFRDHQASEKEASLQ